LRVAVARDADDGEAIELVERLRSESDEFANLWNDHDVGTHAGGERKRLVHPRIGTIELDCQVMVAQNEAQMLLVYTATPGTEDHDKLKLLAVIGTQQFNTDETDQSQPARQ
jgi:MmyB-like transcription regulator ligand binding domain